MTRASRHGIVALVFGPLLGACAHGPATPAEPGAATRMAEGVDPRCELRSLARDIARSRAALGLTPAEREERPRAEDGSVRADCTQRAEQEADALPLWARGWEASCPMPCRHAHAICRAAKRICQIARDLGDADSQRRCTRARLDCRRAREATGDRCTGDCAVDASGQS